MNDILWLILSLSLSGSILTALLLLAKPLYRDRLGRSWQYYIWIVVIARMLLPFSPEDSILGAALRHVDQAIAAVPSEAPGSHSSAFPEESVIASGSGLTDTPEASAEYGTKADMADPAAPTQGWDQMNIAALSQGYNSTDKASTPQDDSADGSYSPQGDSADGSYSPQGHDSREYPASARNSFAFLWNAIIYRLDITFIYKLLLLLYSGVALLLLLKKTVMYRRFIRYIKCGMVRIEDPRLLRLLSVTREQSGIRTPVSLYTNSAVTSPMTVGLFHPFLIIPDMKMKDEELGCILLHELTHIKRLDILYKWVVQLTVCLHWFNPFVYFMEKEISKNCELSCDEAVVRDTDAHTRKIYGDTLLHSLVYAGKQKDNYASLQLSKNAKQIKERLGSIMKYRKKSAAVTVLTTIITVFLCVGSYVTGAYAAQKPAPSTEEEPQNTWEAMARRGETYTYSQTGYYQHPYIFTLGWNLNETGRNYYPDLTRITLSDQRTMTVFLAKDCADYAKEKGVLTALAQLIERLKAEYADSFIPLESPVVVSLEYVGDREVEELAEIYYKDGSLTDFTAVFPALDSTAQLSYCDRMIQDTSIAYFASCLRQMTPEIVSACAEKTYVTDNFFFFNNIVPWLTEEEIDEYLDRAEKDDKNNSFRYSLQEEKELINSFEVLKTALKEEAERLAQAAAAGKAEILNEKTSQNAQSNGKSNQTPLQDKAKQEDQEQIAAQKEAELEALRDEIERAKQLEVKMNAIQEETDRLASPEAAIMEILANADIDASILEDLKQSNRLESLKSYYLKISERLENEVM